MNARIWLWSAIVCAGCGGVERSEPEPTQSETPRKETVFDGTIEAKERARVQTEKASAERKDNLDKAIKDSGEQ